MSAASEITLEVCVDSLQAAKDAARVLKGTKYRLEVCSNLLSGGGLTPSYGLVASIRKLIPEADLMVDSALGLQIQLLTRAGQIMIRPRTGSFCYSQEEAAVMVEDILAFSQLGVMGGLAKNAIEGSANILALRAETPFYNMVTIVPGSGINDTNAADLPFIFPGFREFHLSSGRICPDVSSDVLKRGEELGFGEGAEWKLCAERLQMVREAIERWQATA
ncbi:copper homeostasis protein, partial [Tremellales sp. Uapishka_1]